MPIPTKIIQIWNLVKKAITRLLQFRKVIVVEKQLIPLILKMTLMYVLSIHVTFMFPGFLVKSQMK